MGRVGVDGDAAAGGVGEEAVSWVLDRGEKRR